ncbi:MAG: hypothetical protein KBS67_07310 [Bacteroidales bacterium]|nr:hypothetical protein [Candidatus Cryptobacteroides equifaecalis]
MNKFFNIKRFGRYMVYDLNNAKNKYWLSLILVGLTPVITFVFYQMIFMLIEGSWSPDNGMIAPLAAFTTLVVVTFTFPSKVYGGLTDKRIGSDWLMIPASTFEKWLSMIIVTCVVLPVCVAVLFFGSDALLSVIFPHYYGDSLIHNMNLFHDEFMRQTEDVLDINFTGVGWLNWCENILIFTLGAVVFKKAKPAKTILAYVLLSMLVGNIAMLVFAGTPRSMMEMFDRDGFNAQSLESFINGLNMFVSLTYTLIFTIVLGGLYYRLRTIKL